MIIVLREDLKEDEIAQVCHSLANMGLASQVIHTAYSSLLVVLDDVSTLPNHLFTQLPGVTKVMRVTAQCPLAFNNKLPFLQFKGGACLGKGNYPFIIAGPCAVESSNQMLRIAHKVKEAGATMLRGGAFKPRTNPYDFQGLGRAGLEYLAEASQATGLPVVSEVMSAEQVELAEPFIDMLQIGARNMYNYELLREVGASSKPVFLKRAMSATVYELLSAAEYIMLHGNMQVVLCERGIRTFETQTRNTLDLSAVAVLKNITQLPVIVDPSHGTGSSELVRPMSRAAIACGADGLMIEVHDEPAKALSDSQQAITPLALADIITEVERVFRVIKAGGNLVALRT